MQGCSVTSHCVTDAGLQSKWMQCPPLAIEMLACISTTAFILAKLICNMLLHAWLHSMYVKGVTPQTHIISSGDNLASHITCL